MRTHSLLLINPRSGDDSTSAEEVADAARTLGVEPHFLENCTLYASTEPCAMCAGAIYWSGIGTVVYALSKDTYHRIAGTSDPAHLLNVPAKDLFDQGERQVIVLGPLLEEEAAACYEKWSKGKS